MKVLRLWGDFLVQLKLNDSDQSLGSEQWIRLTNCWSSQSFSRLECNIQNILCKQTLKQPKWLIKVYHFFPPPTVRSLKCKKWVKIQGKKKFKMKRSIHNMVLPSITLYYLSTCMINNTGIISCKHTKKHEESWTWGAGDPWEFSPTLPLTDYVTLASVMSCQSPKSLRIWK